MFYYTGFIFTDVLISHLSPRYKYLKLGYDIMTGRYLYSVIKYSLLR